MMAVMLGLRFVRSRSGFVWPPDRSISTLVSVKMEIIVVLQKDQRNS